jgi:hypothetical protein
LREVGIQNPPGTKDKLHKLSVLNNLPTKKWLIKYKDGFVNKKAVYKFYTREDELMNQK